MKTLLLKDTLLKQINYAGADLSNVPHVPRHNALLHESALQFFRQHVFLARSTYARTAKCCEEPDMDHPVCSLHIWHVYGALQLIKSDFLFIDF